MDSRPADDRECIVETLLGHNAARAARRAYVSLALAGLGAFALRAATGVGGAGSARFFDSWLLDALLIVEIAPHAA